jgi:phenylacetate-coenzyme A ligase PaaK-like adenylate-forming protein
VTDINILFKRRYRAELATTEALSPAKLAQYGLRQRAQLAEFAWRNVPYYRKRLAPLFARGAFDDAAWHKVPVLTRAVATRKYTELQALTLPDYAGTPEISITSGSTGAPLRYRTSSAASVVNAALTERGFDWWAWKAAASWARFISFPPTGRCQSTSRCAAGATGRLPA